MTWQATTLADDDNVAVVLQPVAAGETFVVRTADRAIDVTALEPIALCHKIALVDLAIGDVVIKYGQCIGEATAPIRRGGWVHVHNLRSRRAQVTRPSST
jgi:hypothetical protein